MSMGCMRGKIIIIGLLLMGLFACASQEKKSVQPTLVPPVGSQSSAATAMKEGNRLFALGQFDASKMQYETAIRAQPDLAEAYYNLGLTLDRLGNPKQAHAYYIQAANLAPGHKVIWDSPSLRRYGDVPESASSGGGTPVLPALGGLGGLGSSGGGSTGPGY
ncbi:MAG: tetratricopeptide repeat protein [Nitrospirales bacterium]|nr:tetratricopeptide repeat protein [Nitrospirales bacterium]